MIWVSTYVCRLFWFSWLSSKMRLNLILVLLLNYFLLWNQFLDFWNAVWEISFCFTGKEIKLIFTSSAKLWARSSTLPQTPIHWISIPGCGNLTLSMTLKVISIVQVKASNPQSCARTNRVQLHRWLWTKFCKVLGLHTWGCRCSLPVKLFSSNTLRGSTLTSDCCTTLLGHDISSSFAWVTPVKLKRHKWKARYEYRSSY